MEPTFGALHTAGAARGATRQCTRRENYHKERYHMGKYNKEEYNTGEHHREGFHVGSQMHCHMVMQR